MSIYWVVRKVRAAKDLNIINEIKNLNLLFPFSFNIGMNFPDNSIYNIFFWETMRIVALTIFYVF